MPVYNTQRFLGEAIESILSQTFQDFEFIIIDDGSTDWSWRIIQEYANMDNRIITTKNNTNTWISATRNQMVDLCTGNYIVCQDSDDVSLPERLALSIEYLERNPDCWVVAWDVLVIDDEWKQLWKRSYSNHIKKTILKKSPIAQLASMFRKDVFEEVGKYSEELKVAEDYDLWCKMYGAWYTINNLWIPLAKMRLRTGQTKSTKIKEVIHSTLLVQSRAVHLYWLSPSASDIIYQSMLRTLTLMPNSVIYWVFTRFFMISPRS